MSGRFEVRDLSVHFGGVQAVDGVDFAVGSEELVAIIGPNGAGKTTLFDAICGFIDHVGLVTLDGIELGGMSASRRARAGIGRSFQDARLFPGLTVRETVALALQRGAEDPGSVAQLVDWPTAVLAERRLGGAVEQALDTFGLGGYGDSFISELSTGTRRIVEVASVYVQQPRVILLDEPSSGIAQREVEALADVILRLRAMSGAAVLVVEHDIPLVRRVAERLLVLESGRLIADGAVEEVLEDPAVVAGYLGTTEVAIKRSGSVGGAAPIESVAVTADAPVERAAVPAGLPPRDDFRLPAPRLAGGGVLAAVVMALTALTAGPLPQLASPAAQRGPVVAQAQAAPSPSPEPLAVTPPPLPPPVVLPVPPPPPVDLAGLYVPASPSSSPTPTSSPAASPTCSVLPTPAPDPLGILPTPLPC